MSNHFDIFCRTCSKGGVFHANWGDAQITRYATHLGELAELARAYHKVRDLTGAGIQESASEFADYITANLLDFALAHEGHDVAARSEYGSFADRCAAFYECPNCRNSHACQRAIGHAGDHGPTIEGT